MSTTHRLDSANASTFGSTDLTSATEFSYDAVSQEVLLGTDGKSWVGGTFVDDLHYRVTVTVSDASILPGAPGACEDLTLKAAERACGDGNASRLVYTFTNAVFQGSNRRVGHGGTAEVTLTFIVGGDDGSDPLEVTTPT